MLLSSELVMPMCPTTAAIDAPSAAELVSGDEGRSAISTFATHVLRARLRVEWARSISITGSTPHDEAPSPPSGKTSLSSTNGEASTVVGSC